MTTEWTKRSYEDQGAYFNSTRVKQLIDEVLHSPDLADGFCRGKLEEAIARARLVEEHILVEERATDRCFYGWVRKLGRTIHIYRNWKAVLGMRY